MQVAAEDPLVYYYTSYVPNRRGGYETTFFATKSERDLALAEFNNRYFGTVTAYVPVSNQMVLSEAVKWYQRYLDGGEGQMTDPQSLFSSTS